jgi:hypothetical protein
MYYDLICSLHLDLTKQRDAKQKLANSPKQTQVHLIVPSIYRGGGRLQRAIGYALLTNIFEAK